MQTTIAAHNSQLAAISISPSGRRVATASEKGTVIRIFDTTTGAKLYELRRGLRRLATIYSMSWSSCNKYLAVASNTETVHVFKLEEDQASKQISGSLGSAGSRSSERYLILLNLMKLMWGAKSFFFLHFENCSSPEMQQSPPANDSWSIMGSYLNQVVSASAHYLPIQVSETLMQERAFTYVHHNQPGMRNICALAT